MGMLKRICQMFFSVQNLKLKIAKQQIYLIRIIRSIFIHSEFIAKSAQKYFYYVSVWLMQDSSKVNVINQHTH